MIPSISCEDLTKVFGNFRAVDGVSLSIPEGSIFGFLGPNGAGKSTTIRMLCGVLSPTSGSGHVLGYDIIKEAEVIKQNIGYMSQKFSLYQDLTLNENLDFYAGIYGLNKKQANKRKTELIELADLYGQEHKLAGTLSGGWKQRLALCCALLHQPQVLILDEPTAGVDPYSRRIFWDIIRLTSKQGITVLVSTHYMDEAATCDQIGFIFNGRLLACDSPEQLMNSLNKNNLDDVFIHYVQLEQSRG